MVRFTSGETVPFAVVSVGRERTSALAVLKSSGWSASKTSGSMVTGGLLVAAGVSFEQATPAARDASSNNSGSQAATFAVTWFRSRHGRSGGASAAVPKLVGRVGRQRAPKVEIPYECFFMG